MTISYKDLGLQVNKARNSFVFNDKTIEISQYLPIMDKYDLIMVTLEKAAEDLYYNEVKMDMYFHLHLVMLYSNIEFSTLDRTDDGVLYDSLVSSGFMKEFLANFNKDEYNTLLAILKSVAAIKFKTNISAGAVVTSAINNLPKNAELAKQFIQQIDPAQLKSFIEFVQPEK